MSTGNGGMEVAANTDNWLSKYPRKFPNRVEPKRKAEITDEEPVVCWEETIEIPRLGPTHKVDTHSFRDLSLTTEKNGNYPYNFYSHFIRSPKPEWRQYRFIILENKYLQLMIAPELGGRIYAALDKISGHDIFYRNNGAFYMLGGFGGLYLAGGKEVDYPQTHACTNCRDREARVIRNADKSVSIVISEVELVGRTHWSYTYTLEPDKSHIKEDFQAYNRTWHPQFFHFWNNAGITMSDESVFLYSETLALQHGGSAYITYPDYMGTNNKYWRKLETILGFYLLDAAEGMIGHHALDKDCGTARWGDPEFMAGKKYWSWGRDTDAGHSRRVSLSGENLPFGEIQSGYVENQDHFETLDPDKDLKFTDYWFPVHGTGEFCSTSKYGALAIQPADGGTKVSYCPTVTIPDADIEVLDSGKQVLNETFSIKTSSPAHFTIKGISTGDLDVLIRQNGKVLHRYSEQHKPVQPLISGYEQHNAGKYTPVELATSTDALYELARWEEKFRTVYTAEKIYRKILGKDPKDARANKSLARLMHQRGRFEDAAGMLETSIKRAPFDGETFFLTALNSLWMGDRVYAYRAARQAARSRFPYLANQFLGQMSLEDGNYEDAGRYLKESIRQNGASKRSTTLLSICYRLSASNPSNRPDRSDASATMARELLNRVLAEDPSYHFALWEMGQYDSAHAEEFAAQVGKLHQPYLELAFEYESVGDVPSAVKVLEAAVGNIPPDRPLGMVLYTLAYFYRLTGDDTLYRQTQVKAQKADPFLANPFRLEEGRVLETILADDQDDHKALYYLGILRFSQGRYDEGRVLMEKSAGIRDEIPILHATLGLYWWKKGNDPKKARECYMKAISMAEPSPYLLCEATSLLLQDGAYQEVVDLCEKYRSSSYYHSVIAANFVSALYRMGKYEVAAERITELRLGRNMDYFDSFYRNINMGCGDYFREKGEYAKAIDVYGRMESDPGNVQDGPSTELTRLAEVYLKKGWCYKALGQDAEAQAEFEKAASERHKITWIVGHELQIWESRYYQALALMELGRQVEAEVFLDGLIEFYRYASEHKGDMSRLKPLVESAKEKYSRVIETSHGIAGAEI